MPRNPKPEEDKAYTQTMSCYRGEWRAIKSISSVMKFKTPMDLFRHLVRGLKHPLEKNRVCAPRKK